MLLALEEVAGEFAGASRMLLELEELLTAIVEGKIQTNVPVDESMIDAVRTVRSALSDRERANAPRDILTVIQGLRERLMLRPPRLDISVCVICDQEYADYRGLRGGVCAKCIRNAYGVVIRGDLHRPKTPTRGGRGDGS
jgi:hypothetical protein